jgi:hypothetical protein
LIVIFESLSWPTRHAEALSPSRQMAVAGIVRLVELSVSMRPSA